MNLDVVDRPSTAMTADDAELARFVADLSPVVLAVAAVHMSGSLDIIRSGIKPKPPAGFADQSGSLTAEEAAKLRSKALAIIREWRKAGQPKPYMPTSQELHEMINFLA